MSKSQRNIHSVTRMLLTETQTQMWGSQHSDSVASWLPSAKEDCVFSKLPEPELTKVAQGPCPWISFAELF